ncbi:MAG: HNH endonuclease [Phaeodactylibacter sp.]|nr:HNH endonuclease [Phaeodactylibacter sp.]
MPKRISRARKEQVGKRADHCCEYCLSQADYSPDPFSVEHIIPASKGGTNGLDNLAYSCQGCNNRKYNHTEAIDPVTNSTVQLFHPRQQRWKDHFQWNTSQTILTGLTPTGRATVQKLELNRKGVVNLRYILVLIGEHPPH